MKIKEVLETVGRMHADGVIGRYAIGGWPVRFLPRGGGGDRNCQVTRLFFP
ncbi:MAG: hypothetical protein HY897_11395 [Deltaproteobacteria bacterium]|nr:hypothetical protein [Deltaproteobacteria bacterium]